MKKWEMILLRPRRAKLNGIRKTITSRICIESTECRRSSSGKYSQESQHWASSRSFKVQRQIGSVSWSTSQTGSSSCQCTRNKILCIQIQCEISKDIVDNYRTMFESRISAGATEKLPCSENLRISSWSYDMEGHAKKCVERCCEMAKKTTQQLCKVSTPCIDDHHFKEEELKFVGDLSKGCSQIVLKLLHLARIGRPDIPWSVNKLARSITKWTNACDKRLSRLISYIHHTFDF